MEYEYPIDLDWSNEEMISVINFFNHVEKYYESGVTVKFRVLRSYFLKKYLNYLIRYVIFRVVLLLIIVIKKR
ncbi:UPF0223 family protein [Staphylococcus sp. EG-SA-23]|nr:UPF0223 family protein [Staphylococcus sp. EG-SA-23]